jgi:hypothetical protein
MDLRGVIDVDVYYLLDLRGVIDVDAYYLLDLRGVIDVDVYPLIKQKYTANSSQCHYVQVCYFILFFPIDF